MNNFKFKGFPVKTQYYALPRIFFSALLNDITDTTELKVTLFTLAALYQKPSYPRYVTIKELLADVSLRQCLKGSGGKEEDALKEMLAAMEERGTVIRLAAARDGVPEDIYLLNSESERQAAEKIKSGKLTLGALKGGKGSETLPDDEPEEISPGEIPDIFTLYEENIGMLTPIIADGLKEAEAHYPKAWIAAAISEAALGNKRNWRYIMAVLEHWSAEGKSDGTHQRNPEKGQDPDKYLRGKYGHIVQR
jgi:DNA replication protein